MIVWRALAELRKAGTGLNIKQMGHTTAFVQSYRQITIFPASEGGGERKQPILGEIHFAKKYVATEVITHESTHAALYWAQQLRILKGIKAEPSNGSASPEEELLCYATGRLAKQISERLWKAGFFD